MISTKNKIIESQRQLKEVLSVFRFIHKKIIFTNGCFDLLHIAHIEVLSEAKAIGGIVIVGLNSDISVKALKGENRPIVDERSRALILSSISFVDYVMLFDEPSVLDLVKFIRPDYLVKGGDYTKDQVVGFDFVESYGGCVKVVPMVKEISTTKLISQL